MQESTILHLNLLLMFGSCSVTVTDTILLTTTLLKWPDSCRFVTTLQIVLNGKMFPAKFLGYLIPSFSSKRGHMTEKHVLTGRKHDMLGNQTFEVKLSHQSWKAFDVFDKQILPKLEVIQMAAT